MAVNLSALAGAGQQFFDNNGTPLSGGKLYSYEAGTTTPQATYTSVSGVAAHTNPIILDSAGRVATGEIWLTAGQNYKFVLKTSAEVTIATWDNITGINGTGLATNASNVGYDPAGVGAVTTSAQAKLREIISVNDFGASNLTSSFTEALAAANGRIVTVPEANNTTALPEDYSTALLEYQGETDTRLFSDTVDGTAKKLLKGQFPSPHQNSRRSILGVEAQPQGSGLNGPASADCGLTVGVRKKGFDGATRPPAGEIDGLYIVVRQDGPTGQPSGGSNSSDASGILVDIQNIDDVGFTSAWEAATSNYNRAAGAITRSIQTQIGVLNMNGSPVTSYGYVCSATTGALGTAYYAGKASGASWDYILDAPGSVKIDKYGNYVAINPAWGSGAFSISRTNETTNASTQFNHRGTGALFLNCAEAGAIQFGISNATVLEINAAGHFLPTTNLVGNLGTPTRRFSELYAYQLNLGDSSSNGVYIRSGAGSPEGNVTAPVGSLYLNTSGSTSTTLYVKTSGIGNTGWTAK